MPGVRTTGEELLLDEVDALALERLRVRALGVLDGDVPLFDPAQQPQKVAVTQQVGGLELPEAQQQSVSRGVNQTNIDFNAAKH